VNRQVLEFPVHGGDGQKMEEFEVLHVENKRGGGKALRGKRRSFLTNSKSEKVQGSTKSRTEKRGVWFIKNPKRNPVLGFNGREDVGRGGGKNQKLKKTKKSTLGD